MVLPCVQKPGRAGFPLGARRDSRSAGSILIAIPRIGNLGGANHGIWGSEFEGKSIGIPIGIPRIGNLGGANHGIRGSEFDGKSIEIPIGIPRN